MSIEFIRQYGEHTVDAGDTGTVTIVSQPDWAGLQASMERLQSQQEAGMAIGRYLLTPELITIADLTPEDLQHVRPIVERRAAQATD